MRIPRATYRIQFHRDFPFRKARAILDYLADLGISDLYSSPIFEARAGSTHGYDVLNPNKFNPDLGTPEEFDALVRECQERGLGWLQDIVPNHMAFDVANGFLMDLFEKGQASPYFSYFDVDWNHPYAGMKGKVLAPFLGRYYGEALEDQEIRLDYDGEMLSLRYYDMKFPLTLSSYPEITGHEKDELSRLYANDTAVKTRIDDRIRSLNGVKGDPDSFNDLDRIHSRQIFRLAYWKVASEEINYRRFFVVNDLISLRMEEENVFEDTHVLLKQLLREGKITGLRIDHIDGLYNPGRYLKRLRSEAPENYLVVEKILELHEVLPSHWPVQGTTGYDFMSYVTQLFCESKNQRQFDRIYSRFTETSWNLHSVSVQKKKQIIGEYMAGDIDGLAHLMKNISSRNRYGSDLTLYALRRGIVEVLSRFPIYRTYINEEIFTDFDRQQVARVISEAKERRPFMEHELEFVRRALMSDFGYSLSDEERMRWVHFIKRFQQVSSPVMAKGFEDTVLYVYSRLLSLNEVGGFPEVFGIQIRDFHRYIETRTARHPHSMNASATHDTKRGEDARARLNVLSEIPDEWRKQIEAWSRMSRGKRAMINGLHVPDRNDEYFIYQCLLAHYPIHTEEVPQFRERLKGYVEKAGREAKVHTAWLEPNLGYEEAIAGFIDRVLSDKIVLAQFGPFQQRIAAGGVLNSLAQTLLKTTVPGVCDFYQGCELWDFSFVDPDNRRPVDFVARAETLARLKRATQRADLIAELLANPQDPAIKMFVIHEALQLRRILPELFESGTYIPLRTTGKRRKNVLAFARKKDKEWIVVIVPRLLARFATLERILLPAEVWSDTRVSLPAGAPADWTEVFTRKRMSLDGNLAVSEALDSFPIALLVHRRL